MGTILRLLNDGDNTIQDWGNSAAYDKNSITQISDPNGGSDKREITSIPSPFARLDLFRIAFEYVSVNGLDGKSIYHKLISESMDVAQLFFNIDKINDSVNIIEWRRDRDISELKRSTNKGHKRLGDTLELFLEQDAKAFNFKYFDSLYLLCYNGKGKKTEMDIIGGTSPITLFFTPANDLSYISKYITFGDDQPFDSDYRPLYKRDLEFHAFYRKLAQKFSKYLSDNSFNTSVIDAYIDNSYKELSYEDKIKLDELVVLSNTTSDIILNDGGGTANIFNIPLQKRVIDQNRINANSDFTVKTHKSLKLRPLVLPVSEFYGKLNYVDAQWSVGNRVPYYDKLELSKRVLPGDGTLYPYLTIGDLLTDTIIKVNKPIDNLNFDSQSFEKESYLLPLTPLFFKYFTVQDLKSTLPQGEHMLELNVKPSGVEAILRIPINNKSDSNLGHIQYTRFYNSGATRPDIKEFTEDGYKQNGAIYEYAGTLAIFPFLKYPEEVTPDYRVSLIYDNLGESLFNGGHDFSLSFYKNGERCLEPKTISKNKKKDLSRYSNLIFDSSIYVVKDIFDVINVQLDNASGIVIPNFKDKSGPVKFTFAVDFGTSNTHIEVQRDKTLSTPFTITDHDSQIVTLHKLKDRFFDSDYYKVLEQDLLPFTINNNSNINARCSFPMRTCLSEYKEISVNRFPFAEVNMQVLYDKQASLDYNVSYTDLKWAGGIDAVARINSYFENIIILLRNKVLLNGGSLKDTRVVWFYPTSMTIFERENLDSTWNRLYSQYFSSNLARNIKNIQESIAPYYYYKSSEGASSNTICIDIGGGTTDILIPLLDSTYLTNSIRFGANSIFGDGYSSNYRNNGFIQKYYKYFERFLSEISSNESDPDIANHLRSLSSVLSEFYLNGSKSSDMVSLLFSSSDYLRNQCAISGKGFDDLLYNDGEIKYVFLLFYTAIIYHVANICKLRGLPHPRHIAFSGNGSKVLKLISSSIEGVLKDYTMLIFEEVLGKVYDSNGLTLIQNEHPKESTSKGGIESYDEINTENLKSNDLPYINFNTLVNRESIAIEEAKTMSKEVEITVEDFLDFFFSLNNKFSFFDNFNLSVGVFDKVKKLSRRDIGGFYTSGLNVRQKQQSSLDGGTSASINDNLMFIPLVETLNTLAKDLLTN